MNFFITLCVALDSIIHPNTKTTSGFRRRPVCLTRLLRFRFLFEDIAPEQDHVHDDEQHGKGGKRNPNVGEVARRGIGGESDGRKTEQEQHWEAEHDCPELLIDEVVRGGRLEQRVDLPKQDYARARGAGQHAVERKERLARILRIDALADEVEL